MPITSLQCQMGFSHTVARPVLGAVQGDIHIAVHFSDPVWLNRPGRSVMLHGFTTFDISW